MPTELGASQNKQLIITYETKRVANSFGEAITLFVKGKV